MKFEETYSKTRELSSHCGLYKLIPTLFRPTHWARNFLENHKCHTINLQLWFTLLYLGGMVIFFRAPEANIETLNQFLSLFPDVNNILSLKQIGFSCNSPIFWNLLFLPGNPRSRQIQTAWCRSSTLWSTHQNGRHLKLWNDSKNISSNFAGVTAPQSNGMTKSDCQRPPLLIGREWNHLSRLTRFSFLSKSQRFCM